MAGKLSNSSYTVANENVATKNNIAKEKTGMFILIKSKFELPFELPSERSHPFKYSVRWENIYYRRENGNEKGDRGWQNLVCELLFRISWKEVAWYGHLSLRVLAEP